MTSENPKNLKYFIETYVLGGDQDNKDRAYAILAGLVELNFCRDMADRTASIGVHSADYGGNFVEELYSEYSEFDSASDLIKNLSLSKIFRLKYDIPGAPATSVVAMELPNFLFYWAAVTTSLLENEMDEYGVAIMQDDLLEYYTLSEKLTKKLNSGEMGTVDLLVGNNRFWELGQSNSEEIGYRGTLEKPSRPVEALIRNFDKEFKRERNHGTGPASQDDLPQDRIRERF